jgi:UDP-GlcNAc:undecaprenyl-phosphate GlcNAc-1-phosphate transferase
MIALAAGIAFILSLASMPVIIRLSHHKQWYDAKDHRKIHAGDIPRLGGVGMAFGFVAASVFAILLIEPTISEDPGALGVTSWLFLAGAVLISLIGLIDDFSNIPAGRKFLGQALAALIPTLGGLRISTLAVPLLGLELSLGIFSYPITMFWILAVANGLNLIDGVDGLAGGVSAFAAIGFTILGLIQGNPMLALFGLALFGANLGFLAFNFPPARIFMGDSGSLLLGYLLATLPLFGVTIRPDADVLSMVIPGTLLLIPIVDTVGAIIRRIRRRQPIYAPDRAHLHHKLLDLGLNARGVAIVVYITMSLLVGVTVLMQYLPRIVSNLIFVALVVAGFATLGLLAHHHGRKQESSDASADDSSLSDSARAGIGGEQGAKSANGHHETFRLEDAAGSADLGLEKKHGGEPPLG